MIAAFFLPVDKLSELEKTEMRTLLQRHFNGVTPGQFEVDLSEKNWVILLREEEELKGFSTLQFYQAEHQGEPIRVIYSGDTITDPSMWSSPSLAQAWGKAILAMHENCSERLYWLLISSGFRTYRFLSTFFKEFYPRHDQATPITTQALMDQLAHDKFQANYAEGLVRFPRPQVLTPELCQIPPERLKDPHVAFFERVNPGHANGDELVCLAEIAYDNVTRAGLRVWHSNYPLQVPYPFHQFL